MAMRDLVEMDSRFLGITLTFLNMILSTTGFIMQRKAHLLNEAVEFEKQRPSHRRPLWVAGVTLYIVACVPDVWACTLIPQILYSTMGCLRLVMMSVFGHAFLKEEVGRREVLGISLCFVGAALCVWYGPDADASVAVDAETLYHPNVLVYAVAGFVFLCALLLLVHMDSFGCLQPTNKLYRCALPLTTALACGIEKVFNTELGFMQMPKQLLHQPLWLSMVASVGLLGLMDFYLNVRAAQRMSVQVYVPLAFAFGISLQCFQGMWVFDETKEMTVTHSLLTLMGIIFALTGALVIQLEAPDTSLPAQTAISTEKKQYGELNEFI